MASVDLVVLHGGLASLLLDLMVYTVLSHTQHYRWGISRSLRSTIAQLWWCLGSTYLHLLVSTTRR